MAWTPYYSSGWQSGEAGGTPITPEALNHMDDGIAGAVEKSGGTMTGDLTLPHVNVQSGGRYTTIYLRDSSGVPRGLIWSDGQSGRIFFRSIHPDVASANIGSIYTEYFLYQSSLTSGSVSYKIYTERDTIPIDHGGTGATSAAAARTNLGAAPALQTKSVTATTDTNGNISLGLSAASYHVLSVKSSSRIVTPWVSGDNNNWYARVTGVNGSATASTSVTVTVVYIAA